MRHNDPILDGLADAAAGLVGEGHKEDAVYDGMLTLSVGWAADHVGLREAGRLLYVHAMRCAFEADRIEALQSGTTH